MASVCKKVAAMAAVVAVALLGCAVSTCQAQPGYSYPIPGAPRYPPPGAPASTLADHLAVGYYKSNTDGRVCLDAEAIVRKTVEDALKADRGTGAGLIRLFFHDCFVRGCDASVLLDNTTANPQPEKFGPPNLTLRGYEVIDAAKAALEVACPGAVSCADIVAFAGRDATVVLSNGSVAASSFSMPAGRYDGLVSFSNETLPNLPAPFFNLSQLTASFAAKNLTADDMVTLSGAHTVGRSHCSSFSDRLPPNPSDMDAAFASNLTEQCKPTINGGSDNAVDQDTATPSFLDSQYYRNVINRRVLFNSDAALLNSTATKVMVLLNAEPTSLLWRRKFTAAMVKMGSIDIKTKDDGEIRKQCRFVNPPPQSR